MNVYPPALSSPTRSSWVSVSGWLWPRACGRHGRFPGGLKVLGASWRPGLLHLCQERRVPAFAQERTPGWREEGGCRLAVAWDSDPLSQWDSTACGGPNNDGGGGITMPFDISLHIKHRVHMQTFCSTRRKCKLLGVSKTSNLVKKTASSCCCLL